jgi:hypothetical protein
MRKYDTCISPTRAVSRGVSARILGLDSES